MGSDLDLLGIEMMAAYILIWICSMAIFVMYKKRGYLFTEEEKPAAIPVLVFLALLVLISVEISLGYGSGVEVFDQVFFGE